MVKIKICGLTSPEDIRSVAAAGADYAGFVINYPKSHRSVNPERAEELARMLPATVTPVGVFVDEPLESVAAMVRRGAITAVQLQGAEIPEYILDLKSKVKCTVIKAFVAGEEGFSPEAIDASPADYVLIDGGRGAGKGFDPAILAKVKRPFFMAGGLTPETVRAAAERYRPLAVDLSSGVETDGKKDNEKIVRAVRAAHGE